MNNLYLLDFLEALTPSSPEPAENVQEDEGERKPLQF